jgi:hypothetical protein
MQYRNKMQCQRCCLPIEDFSDVMMDSTLLFHKQCYAAGVAELKCTLEIPSHVEALLDSAIQPRASPA